MANTVELQDTDLFEELDDTELTVVVGGANGSIGAYDVNVIILTANFEIKLEDFDVAD